MCFWFFCLRGLKHTLCKVGVCHGGLSHIDLNLRNEHDKKIFNHLKSIKKWGADDFYENGIFSPDLILEDLRILFQSDHFLS